MSIGTSTQESIVHVMRWIRQLQPKSVLDVGCGWGRWGFLIREHELWQGRYTQAEWQIEIQGIDINPHNWTGAQELVYDTITTADIRHTDFLLRHGWDLVIATDVLEHLPKVDAVQVLTEAVMRSKAVIVGLPVDSWGTRPGFPDNPAEAHVSEWELLEVSRLAEDRGWSCEMTMIQTEDPLPYGLYLLEKR